MNICFLNIQIISVVQILFHGNSSHVDINSHLCLVSYSLASSFCYFFVCFFFLLVSSLLFFTKYDFFCVSKTNSLINKSVRENRARNKPGKHDNNGKNGKYSIFSLSFPLFWIYDNRLHVLTNILYLRQFEGKLLLCLKLFTLHIVFH